MNECNNQQSFSFGSEDDRGDGLDFGNAVAIWTRFLLSPGKHNTGKTGRCHDNFVIERAAHRRPHPASASDILGGNPANVPIRIADLQPVLPAGISLVP